MSSGKPLEVACAQAFLAAGWKARLNSHFEDFELSPVRELDVLVEREEPLPAPVNMTVRVRALVSCRGFPSERSPLVYSVSTSCVPSFAPRLLSSYRAFRTPQNVPTYGSLQPIEESGARRLLLSTKLDTARPVVAFDVVERTETIIKKGKNKGSVTVDFGRLREGDKQLFGAIDSCVKAALFWLQEDYQMQQPIYFATLNVPVCILSVPFWDACIDGGSIAQPEIQYRGYQTSLYPYRTSSREVMALMWTADNIAQLVEVFDDLFTWFRDEFKKLDLQGPPSSVP